MKCAWRFFMTDYAWVFFMTVHKVGEKDKPRSVRSCRSVFGDVFMPFDWSVNVLMLKSELRTIPIAFAVIKACRKV
jgi:hypothetical protein